MELIADIYCLCFSSLVISFAAAKVKFDLKTDISSSANQKKYQDGILQIQYLTATSDEMVKSKQTIFNYLYG